MPCVVGSFFLSMLILTQNNDAIFDLDKFSCIFTEDAKVYAISYAGESTFLLGTYETEARALEVVAEIFTLIGSQDKYELPII